MTYAVKKIFYTGCDLWSGREQDRARATCRFCATDFVGTNGTAGGRYVDADALTRAVETAWRGGGTHRLVVLTGGEPLLQVDAALTAALYGRGFEIAVEMNGTQEVPPKIDWVCVSPKAGADLVLNSGDEIKLAYPQSGAEPERFAGMAFDYFILQPMDGSKRAANTAAAIAYCLAYQVWPLGVQTHKNLGIR